MNIKTLTCAIILFGNSATAFGESENPYAKLYRKRLEVASLQVQSQKQVAENERVKWLRMKSLMEQGAVPIIEAENQEKLWRVAVAKVQVAENKALEAKALLGIAQERTSAGLDMPVCSYNP
jgi:hypothetical protein